ncbi:Single tm domain protein [Entamoeba marina]
MFNILLFCLIFTVFAIPNPAAVNCNKYGFKSVSLKTNDGDLSVCEIENQKYVDAWALFREQRGLKSGKHVLQYITVEDGKVIRSEPVELDEVLKPSKE